MAGKVALRVGKGYPAVLVTVCTHSNTLKGKRQHYLSALQHLYCGFGFGDVAGNKVEERLLHISKPLFYLPNLAIHLKTAEEIGAFTINKVSTWGPCYLCSRLGLVPESFHQQLFPCTWKAIMCLLGRIDELSIVGGRPLLSALTVEAYAGFRRVI